MHQEISYDLGKKKYNAIVAELTQKMMKKKGSFYEKVLHR